MAFLKNILNAVLHIISQSWAFLIAKSLEQREWILHKIALQMIQ